MAIAAWVHDDDGASSTRHDLSVHYVTWLGDRWSSPAVLAATNAAETAPSLAISGDGLGVATWVHDDDGDASTVSDRYLANDYWIDGAWVGMRVRDDWPAGALNPQPAFTPGGQLVIVFTAREQDDHGQYYGEGTRDLLWIARWFDDAWQVESVRKRIVAHEPHLRISDDNQATIVYRGFQEEGSDGYGGDVMINVADLNSSELEWSEPQFRTQDAARDWRIGAAWEPVSERNLIFSQHTDLYGQENGLSAAQGAARTSSVQGDLFALDVPLGVDVGVCQEDIVFSDDQPEEGDEVVITATFSNLGLQPIYQPFGILLEASGDVLVDTSFDESVPPNSSRDVVAVWTKPGGAKSVRLTLDGGENLDELDEENNAIEVLLGAMPSPQFLVAFASSQGEAIVLAWQSPETEAVAACHVLRGDQPGGPYTEIAETEDNGYLDSDVLVDQPCYYVLTAVDYYGEQSDPSTEAMAIALAPLAPHVHLPLVACGEPSSGRPRVLWVETHLAQETLSWDRAQELDPEHPDWVYCGRLAQDLAASHSLVCHTSGVLTEGILGTYEAVVLPSHDEELHSSEIEALNAYMAVGGGVLVLGGADHVVDALIDQNGIAYDGRPLFEVGGDGDIVMTDLSAHDAVQGVTRMVTNWDGSVVVSEPSVRLVTSPGPTVHRDLDDDMTYDVGEPFGPFHLAAAYAEGDARMVVHAGAPIQDHGYDDRHYEPLMRAYLDWLTEAR